MTKLNYKLNLSEAAQSHIANILRYTRKEYGLEGQKKYRALIQQAFKDIQNNPTCLESRQRDELIKGVRTYHLEFSKLNVEPPFVKKPRHFIAYQIKEQKIEVLAVMHDIMDLTRHLPEGVLRN